MPLARPVLLLLCCIAIPTFLTFLSLLSAHPRHHAATESSPTAEKGGIRSFLSFHTPSSLFPPSAIISLTDENSTFFLARPADFGPELVSKGLSGQLWVGSGFANDNSGKGGATSGAEGELGCSDVPGWEDNRKLQRVRSNVGQPRRLRKPSYGGATGDGNLANVPGSATLIEADQILTDPSSDDGTDNYLHHPLPESQVARPGHLEKRRSAAEGPSTEHADIQSLQETAEITAKIALLSRGGCGFLEKVKWAQRRGAAALIVGDDTRGGALVTMYARGDTSNISIPSLFTSHTTAHLLSSLIPSEGYPDDVADVGHDVNLGDAIKAQDPTPQDHRVALEIGNDRPTFTPSAPKPKVTSISSNRAPARRKPSSVEKLKDSKNTKKSSWFPSLFKHDLLANDARLSADSRRPPSSGRLNWINEKWNEELMAEKQSQKPSSSIGKSDPKRKEASKSPLQHDSGDGFEIGIQDWRDPDLVTTKTSSGKANDGSKVKAAAPTASLTSSKKAHGASKSPQDKGLSGGSITPGSGEYRTPGHSVQVSKNSPKDAASGQEDIPSGQTEADEENWFSRILWGDDDEDAELREEYIAKSTSQGHSQNLAVKLRPQQHKDSAGSSGFPDDQEHEGLWVTLTPTTMSTTPFFDTLLVLVVSPLITLTVVYALLLIRSRMRRRRWRAPKSVVEQLPVRTYQTMPCSSTTSSSRLASPFTSSPTSPLLQSSPRSIAPRSGPRSRTASSIDDAISVSLDEATAKAVAKQEKSRRKYKGKQIECVVCLEEYVEGHSQVMSLPCGHEFHADCITPWLTTRRRTCPICKNDVVRSMIARPTSGPPGIALAEHQEAHGDDVQVLAAESTNESPSSAIPIPGNTNDDLEQGDDLAETLVESQSGRRGWRGLASFSLSAFSGEAAWRQEQADRNR